MKVIAQRRDVTRQRVFGNCTREMGYYRVAQFEDAVCGWLLHGSPALEHRLGEYVEGRRFWPKPPHTVDKLGDVEGEEVREFFSVRKPG